MSAQAPSIRLAYRQVIDHTSEGAFEQEVFHKTYSEFKVQQQSFSKGLPLSSWSDIKAAHPKAHPALPYKVSFALAGVMHRLGGKIPGLKDTMGEAVVPYSRYIFDLLSSDTQDPSAHKVSLVYISEELTLHRTIGDYFLLEAAPLNAGARSAATNGSAANGSATNGAGAQGDTPRPTFLLQIQPLLSIVGYVSYPDTPRTENGHYYRQNASNTL